MARGIKLRRYDISNANHYYLHGFRLKVDVAEVAGGMTPEIFVYHRKPPNPDTGEVVDVCVTIASFVDMSIYPVGAPDPAMGEFFYRAASVEFDIRSLRDYTDVWNVILREANALCAAMDRADSISPAEEQWAGSEPTSEESV